jgi:hypothetical protein
VEEARELLEELEQLPRGRYVPATALAIAYTRLGEPDRAFQWLARAYHDREVGLVILAANSVFDPLRSDPRFKDLLGRVGLASVPLMPNPSYYGYRFPPEIISRLVLVSVRGVRKFRPKLGTTLKPSVLIPLPPPTRQGRTLFTVWLGESHERLRSNRFVHSRSH